MDNIYNFTKMYSIYNKVYYDTLDKSILNGTDRTNVNEISSTMKAHYTKLLSSYYELQSQIEKVRKIIPSDMQQLFGKLSTECDNLIKMVDEFTSSISPEILNSEEKSVECWKKYEEIVTEIDNFDTTFTDTLSVYQDYMTEQIRSKKVTIEELEEMFNSESLTFSQKKSIHNVLETAKAEKVLEEQKAEQTAMEDEKGNLSNKQTNTNAAKSVQKEGSESLNDRLNGVKYSGEEYYASALRAVRIDYELEKIGIAIERLQKKKHEFGNLSMKDAIQLQSLCTQKAQLEESLLNDNLTKSQLKREENLFELSEDIKSYQEKIREIQAKRSNAKSKLFKKVSQMISAKKTNKLKSKIEKLQAKQLSIETKQRESMMLSFNKENGKIVNKANAKATKDAVKDKAIAIGKKVTTAVNNTVTEVRNIATDISDFVHRRDRVEEVVNSDAEIVMTSEPVILDIDYSLIFPQDAIAMGMSM